MPDLVTRLRAAGCVFAEDEAALLTEAAESPEHLESLVVRRVAGEPLEYVVGWVDFDGLRIGIEPGVFIPRQRTTFLVELAAAAIGPATLRVRTPTSARSWPEERAFAPRRARVRTPTSARSWPEERAFAPRDARVRGATVVDLCCGSGALGLAVARRRPGVVLHASDSDPAAGACAARNLAAVDGRTHTGDLDAALPRDLAGQVDVILANVPYVPTSAIALMPSESRDHEPRSTVDGGADGLDVLRRVAAVAPTWLRPGGRLLSEISVGQSDDAVQALERAGLSATIHRDDERDATVVSATAPAGT